MAFWGCEFIFDGLPCTDFGLMVYDFGSHTQGDVGFQPGDVAEDRIAARYDSLMYGLTNNKSLEYTLIFGANLESVDAGANLDRFEIEAIAAWLTGHNSRKWLVIVQDDMESFRYKCHISELQLINSDRMPWAFSCKVSCDSPFAYTFPEEFKVTTAGTASLNLFNRSSYNGYYRPKMEIALPGTTSIAIKNLSDNGRTTKFEGLPTSGQQVTITVDNQNQVITNSLGLNFYPYFNMNFFRMKRGDNLLEVIGNGTVKFICEFPVNIGG